MAQEFIHIIVERQDNPEGNTYTEEFKVPYRKNMNVISVLMEVQKNPVNAKGEKSKPVVWDCNCLEEVCGACTMIINGKPRQACTALIDQIEQPVRLAPLSSFPLIRDLMVDRQVMFDSLKKVKAWIPIDGTYELGPGPRLAEREREWAYELSKCMTCGCCMEACPNFNERSKFMGPAPINQVRLFNVHPTGEMHKEDRLEAIMGPGGITDCGNSQNCLKACPKEIPLTTSLADLNKQTTKHAIKSFFNR
ncbi:succinate dehydrogenase iron-sulfur subunit [Desulfuribacillus stibiiarsenatis]|uniref:succinate dehydrogenase n=1 Tax=Desulfuribacillus stibiiarsenatis TaxID=1390249 RepID=A0A1E5LAE2_9FIRM|nr:succinate dehydrogenase iron-sulfur subunit [Desulfuribacillus stibiiarsenatis]OEH87019.1 succinate dehydrogenase iron-sulfur subunit [Desulfuribacillus stibiiarsenatis]